MIRQLYIRLKSYLKKLVLKYLDIDFNINLVVGMSFDDQEAVFRALLKTDDRSGDPYISFEDEVILNRRLPWQEEIVSDKVISYWFGRSVKAIQNRRSNLLIKKEDYEQ